MKSEKAELAKRERRRAYYLANKEKVKARVVAWKRDNPDKVKTAQNKYRVVHAEQERRRHDIYRESNRESIRISGRRYYKENAEKSIATSRRWLKNNPEWAAKTRKSYRQSHPELFRAASKKFRASHPEYGIAQTNRRRARKKAAAIGTDRVAYRKFVSAVKRSISIKCYWCRKPVPKGRRHIDHIVPLAKRGADDVSNLCCACARCNLKKHDNLPEEFSGQHQIIFATANP